MRLRDGEPRAPFPDGKIDFFMQKHLLLVQIAYIIII